MDASHIVLKTAKDEKIRYELVKFLKSNAFTAINQNARTNLAIYNQIIWYCGYKAGTWSQAMRFDALSIRAERECGDASTTYKLADFNNDCYVDFEDLAMLAGNWLKQM